MKAIQLKVYVYDGKFDRFVLAAELVRKLLPLALERAISVALGSLLLSKDILSTVTVYRTTNENEQGRQISGDPVDDVLSDQIEQIAEDMEVGMFGMLANCQE